MNQLSELQQALADRDHAREERDTHLGRLQCMTEERNDERDISLAWERKWEETEATLTAAREELATLKAEVDALKRSDAEHAADMAVCPEDWSVTETVQSYQRQLAEANATCSRLQPYVQHQARLDVFNEIHQHWEFADLSEEEFDAWMHEQIKAEMKALKEGGLIPVPSSTSASE